MTQKACKKCGEIKELSFFPKYKNMKDGYLNKCNDCLKEYQKKWRQENAEKKREANKRHYQENKGRYRQLHKKWQEENPERLKVLSSNRYARRRARKEENASYKVGSKELAKIYQKPCVFCGTKENIEIDHVIPIAKGGVHGIGNLQPLCKVCNSKKSDNYMMQFKMESYG